MPKFRSGVESFQCGCVGGRWGEIQQAKFRMGRERSRGPCIGDVSKYQYPCLHGGGGKGLGVGEWW